MPNFEIVNGLHPIDTGALSLPKAAVAMAVGDLVYSDRSNKVLAKVTNSVGTTVSSLYLVTKAAASGDAEVEVVPVTQNLILKAVCANNTASTHLLIRHAINSSGAVNNTTSDVATTLGLFEAIGVVGAAADKILLGRIVTVGQVTA